MSFSFAFVGPREKVLAKIDESIEAMQKFNNDPSQAKQAKEARQFIAAEMEKFPAGKVVFVKASGHHSLLYGGNISVSVSEFGEYAYIV